MKADEIILDGAQGEGGGQILRSALSLSAITGKSFRLENIRAGRKTPGLMRQHLSCVRAAAALCDAECSDVGIGSQTLEFSPGRVRSANYSFAIGSAGSTCLLLQTILPILLHADSETETVLQGGTHALKSPVFEYIDEIYLPMLRQMGAAVDATMTAPGFFPAGGGEIVLRVKPSRLEPVFIHRKNTPHSVSAEVVNTPEIPESVAQRELRRVASQIDLITATETRIPKALSPGNLLILRAKAEPTSCPGTLVCVSGAKNKRSEHVGKQAVKEMKHYLNSPAPVDEHLADQLLLPMTLTGGGGFTAAALTPHFHSNIEVIHSFLPIKTTTEQIDRFAWKVELQSE